MIKCVQAHTVMKPDQKWWVVWVIQDLGKIMKDLFWPISHQQLFTSHLWYHAGLETQLRWCWNVYQVSHSPFSLVENCKRWARSIPWSGKWLQSIAKSSKQKIKSCSKLIKKKVIPSVLTLHSIILVLSHDEVTRTSHYFKSKSGASARHHCNCLEQKHTSRLSTRVISHRHDQCIRQCNQSDTAPNQTPLWIPLNPFNWTMISKINAHHRRRPELVMSFLLFVLTERFVKSSIKFSLYPLF